MNDLKRFLDEDVGSGDITTELFVPEGDGVAEIVCEDDAVVSGLEEAHELFGIMNVDLQRMVDDGTKVKKGAKVAVLTGPKSGIMTAERTALNFMMRMSGISTMTSGIVEECRKADPEIIIAGTRKTTPGFRKYEKKAIALGGGDPHRFGLYDAVLIKDNHILAAGGVLNAMELAKKVPFSVKVEIEVESMDDAIIAAENGADIIMADNLPPKDVKAIRDAIRSIDPGILVEASGRITPENAKDYAGSCDIISLGSLTHSVKAIHFSLRLL